VKVMLIAGACLLLAIAVVVAIGAMLPTAHQARRTAIIGKPRNEVFAMIPARWEALPPHDGHPMWREVDKRGRAIRYEQVAADPPAKLVTRIANTNLPYGGTWTYELKQAGDDQTEITITEDGEVYNPLFRFVSKFILGHTATIDRYLKAMQEDGPRR